MTMLIREGTLEEALQVVTRVKEFANGETLDSMSQRLGDKNSLILVAEKNGAIVGLKSATNWMKTPSIVGLVVLRRKLEMRVSRRCC